MRWEAWVLATLFALSMFLAVAQAGKPRDPNPEGVELAIVLVLIGAFMYLVIRLGVA